MAVAQKPQNAARLLANLPRQWVMALTALVALFLWASPADAKSYPRNKPIVISIVSDGPSEPLDQARELIQQEIASLTKGEFRVVFDKKRQHVANWTPAGINSALKRALADPKVDIVITLGILSSDIALKRRSAAKPIIAAIIIDRTLQQAPYKDGNSGRPHLSYIAYPTNIERDVRVLHEITGFRHLGCLMDGQLLDTVPTLAQACTRAAEALGAKVNAIAVDPAKLPMVLQQMDSGIDAVYLGPLPRLSSKDFATLINAINKKRLPSFTFAGKETVTRGVLAGIAPPVDIKRMTRRVGLNTQRILNGESPGRLPVDMPGTENLTINMETARRIGFSPKWTTLETAELIKEDQQRDGKRLSLTSVVKQAVTSNQDLQVAERAVAAGAQGIRSARSQLLPQLGLVGEYIEIDEDRVLVPGSAERVTAGSVVLNQILYSETDWATLAIEKHVQRSRIAERDRVKYDVVLDTAETYLDVLRTKTIERIQKQNLALTRSNLDIARTRKRAGTARSSEVYRWERQVATDQRSVIDAEAQTHQAEIALNRLRHRPMEEAFDTTETGVDDPALITNQKSLLDLTDNPASFAIFRDFLVKEGLKASPERQQLLALITAQERTLASARRAYWQPDLNLSAERREILSRDGFEAANPGIVDDEEQTIGVQLSFPLFTSGSRGATKVKAKEELEQLRAQLRATEERIDQRIRSALHAAHSSYAGIRLSREAADAANRNLKVVRAAYYRGATSILSLLDAQNIAVVSDQSAANAVHDFLKDLMQVERAISRFDFFLSREEQQQWIARMREYYHERGIPMKMRR